MVHPRLSEQLRSRLLVWVHVCPSHRFGQRSANMCRGSALCHVSFAYALAGVTQCVRMVDLRAWLSCISDCGEHGLQGVQLDTAKAAPKKEAPAAEADDADADE